MCIFASYELRIDERSIEYSIGVLLDDLTQTEIWVVSTYSAPRKKTARGCSGNCSISMTFNRFRMILRIMPFVVVCGTWTSWYLRRVSMTTNDFRSTHVFGSFDSFTSVGCSHLRFIVFWDLVYVAFGISTIVGIYIIILVSIATLMFSLHSTCTTFVRIIIQNRYSVDHEFRVFHAKWMIDEWRCLL